MLSNIELKKEFGRHIGLFPFIEKNIEGASIYFSASKCAWSLKSQQSVVDKDKIKIFANDTTIILNSQK